MRYRKITSPSNPVIRDALKLKGRKGVRGGMEFLHAAGGLQKYLIIEGHRILQAAINSNADIKRLFFTGNYKTKNEEFLREVSRKGIELIETTEQILSKISDTETPQGIAAIVSYKTQTLRELQLKNVPLIVVCDGIQDPGNLGTIIRTSDAAGADAVVILPGTCDAFATKAIRSTAGSIFNLHIICSESDILLKWLREKAIALFVTDINAPKTIYDVDLRRPLAFVFGNEAGGVSENLKKKGDMLLNIPIPGGAESLNVATSAAICLYEAVRQRREQS